MKRVALNILAIALAVNVLAGLVGCVQQPGAARQAEDKAIPATTTIVPAPDEAKAAPPTVIELPQDIAFLNGISNKGNLLVRLWEDKQERVIGRDVYEYDIASKKISHLVGPSDSRLVMGGNVSLFDSWLLWTEVPPLDDRRPIVEGLGWKLHLKNLESGDDTVIAQDDLGILRAKGIVTNLGPNASINGAHVAWDQFKRNGDSFDSQIFLYDLKSKEKKVIARIERAGLDSAVQSPQLYGNLVVWSKVFFDRANLVAYPDVYLLDIATGEEERLTENGKSFTPVVSGNYVAWQYRSTPEGVYGQIELYDLVTHTLTRITNAKPREELWGPTIGSRVIAWQPGLADKAEVYDLSSQRLLVLDSGYITRVFTNNNTVAWQWNVLRDRINPLDRRIRYVHFSPSN